MTYDPAESAIHAMQILEFWKENPQADYPFGRRSCTGEPVSSSLEEERQDLLAAVLDDLSTQKKDSDVLAVYRRLLEHLAACRSLPVS
jgi:hypothetical protein